MGRSWLPLVAAASLAGCSLLDAADDGPSAEASTDAAAARSDGAPAVCALTDEFADGVADARWEIDSDDDAGIRQVGGMLEISFTGSSESWAGYQLRAPIDLTEGEIRLTVTTAGGAYTGLEVRLDDMELAFYAEDVDSLIGEVIGTDASDDWEEIPYLPGLHLIWRIRTQDGVVYWEVSQDGAAWESIHMQPFPFPLDAVSVVIEAGGLLGDPPALIESFAATPTGCAE